MIIDPLHNHNAQSHFQNAILWKQQTRVTFVNIKLDFIESVHEQNCSFQDCSSPLASI